MRLPDPMLARPGPLPSGSGWSFELKWDGFRAMVSTEDGLRVRSRRGWKLTPVLPEPRNLPAGLVLDGELVAWRGREPWFPNVCRRKLNHDLSLPVTFVAFDLLRVDGTDVMQRPFAERRAVLEEVVVSGPGWALSETFEDGQALYAAVCDHGLEGVVAKRRSSRYGSGERGWIKLKNPNYWRRELEIAAIQGSASAAFARMSQAGRANSVQRRESPHTRDTRLGGSGLRS
jgi:bifunctional non-homologous end joining protein LigD